MYHLIKSMHMCLREAISNYCGFIYYWQFLLLYCFMPVFFVLNDVYVFLYFAISSTSHFYHLDTYLITNNNCKNNFKNLTSYINFRDCIYSTVINSILAGRAQREGEMSMGGHVPPSPRWGWGGAAWYIVICD